MVTEELIQREYTEATTKYKKLFPPHREGKDWKICGYFDVIDSDGHCWDTYGIHITIPPNYPYELPSLTETTCKITRHEDWHNINGVCCLSTTAVIFASLGGKITLVKWLDRFVHDFLANHIIKLRDEKYAKGEYPHGVEGIIHGYKEIFNVQSISEIVLILRMICKISEERNTLDLIPQTTYQGIPYYVLYNDMLQIKTFIARSCAITKSIKKPLPV